VMDVAKKHKLLVIEDAAEALGSYYKSRPVGVHGDAATFSFYGNKTVTTGEGGMIVFKDKAVAERAATLRDHGMLKTKRYWHAEVGYNYRMTNIQAAIGVAQFERLDEFVSAKRWIAKMYSETLERLGRFDIPAQENDCVNSYWLYTCMIKAGAGFTRDQLIDYLNRNGIETRPVFYPIHIMPPYVNFGAPESLKVSADLSQRGMSFPTSVNLTEVELAHICKMVTKFVEKF
jgi:perosamine synthetase